MHFCNIIRISKVCNNLHLNVLIIFDCKLVLEAFFFLIFLADILVVPSPFVLGQGQGPCILSTV